MRKNTNYTKSNNKIDEDVVWKLQVRTLRLLSNLCVYTHDERKTLTRNTVCKNIELRCVKQGRVRRNWYRAKTKNQQHSSKQEITIHQINLRKSKSPLHKLQIELYAQTINYPSHQNGFVCWFKRFR